MYSYTQNNKVFILKVTFSRDIHADQQTTKILVLNIIFKLYFTYGHHYIQWQGLLHWYIDIVM